MEATVGTELTHMVGARVGKDASLLRRGGRRRLGREGKRTASTGRSGGSGSSSSGGGTRVQNLACNPPGRVPGKGGRDLRSRGRVRSGGSSGGKRRLEGVEDAVRGGRSWRQARRAVSHTGGDVGAEPAVGYEVTARRGLARREAEGEGSKESRDDREDLVPGSCRRAGEAEPRGRATARLEERTHIGRKEGERAGVGRRKSGKLGGRKRGEGRCLVQNQAAGCTGRRWRREGRGTRGLVQN